MQPTVCVRVCVCEREREQDACCLSSRADSKTRVASVVGLIARRVLPQPSPTHMHAVALTLLRLY